MWNILKKSPKIDAIIFKTQNQINGHSYSIKDVSGENNLYTHSLNK